MNKDLLVTPEESYSRSKYLYDSFNEYLIEKEVRNGVIRINQEINSDSIMEWLRHIDFAIEEGKTELILIINSNGGNAYDAFALHDKMLSVKSMGVKIKAIVEGIAASAAGMIVLHAADERIARPNSYFLLHEVRRFIMFSNETTSDMEDQTSQMLAITKRVCDILSKRCGRTEDEVNKVLKRRETWMNAEEALTWGLVDKIE